MTKRIVLTMFLAILFFFFHLTSLDASSINNEKSTYLNKNSPFKYLSPLPGSKYNKTQTNVIIKSEYEIDLLEINVKGSQSGLHTGTVVMKDNNRTVLFYPSLPFDNNETVTVELINSTGATKYQFGTEAINLAMSPKLRFMYEKPEIMQQIKKDLPEDIQENRIYNDIDLPLDYPAIVTGGSNTSPGIFSLSPFGMKNGVPTPNYIILLDNYGIPIFYRKTVNPVVDFKKQTNGLLSYFDWGSGQFYLMNDQYKVIDSVTTKNGYPTDLHELIITKDNHYLMMSYDVQKINMDTVVSGGNPEATVVGLIIQELDENKDVIFQWRSWDHFKITDATPDIDLTGSYIDYSHGNAIELDTDGNFLISSRHMDEVTKISRETGEIIWRWGGSYCENNQFTFVNDSTGFSHQHDIRRLPNGNVTLFDNGNLHSVPFSRGVEYMLDEELKLATMVSEVKNNPITFSVAMGNYQRLENGNSILGWGWNNVPPSISEVDRDGSAIFFISLPDTLLNYRAFKFQWKTGLFSFSKDTLQFDDTLPGDSSDVFFTVTNNSNEQLNLNSAYLNTPEFRLDEEMPMELASGETRQLKLSFHPQQGGNYSGRLYLRLREKTDMIAQSIELKAFADTSSTDVNDLLLGFTYSLSQNYPNPFNPVTLIKYSVPSEDLVKLKVFDVLGREVAFLKNEIQKPGSYEVEFAAGDLSSGIYFYTLETGSFSSTKKMLLLR